MSTADHRLEAVRRLPLLDSIACCPWWRKIKLKLKKTKIILGAERERERRCGTKYCFVRWTRLSEPVCSNAYRLFVLFFFILLLLNALRQTQPNEFVCFSFRFFCFPFCSVEHVFSRGRRSQMHTHALAARTRTHWVRFRVYCQSIGLAFIVFIVRKHEIIFHMPKIKWFRLLFRCARERRIAQHQYLRHLLFIDCYTTATMDQGRRIKSNERTLYPMSTQRCRAQAHHFHTVEPSITTTFNHFDFGCRRQSSSGVKHKLVKW